MNRLIVLAVTASLMGCATVSRRLAPVEKKVAGALISDEQEAQLGAQVHQELVTKEKLQFVTDPEINAYVKGLVAKLTPAANKERKLDWQVYVVDDPRMVNAFAVPGGRIYVFTGLLLAAQNEAQVVGVLGHELGHVVGRHAARRLVYAFGLSAVAGMALGENPNQLAALATQLLGGGTLLAYGREMEIEADQYGARYAHTADYDPRQVAEFFRMLAAKKGDMPQLLAYLSTHPTNAERIARVHAFILKGGFTGSQLAPERLAAIQAEIRTLPSAAAPPPPAVSRAAPEQR